MQYTYPHKHLQMLRTFLPPSSFSLGITAIGLTIGMCIHTPCPLPVPFSFHRSRLQTFSTALYLHSLHAMRRYQPLRCPRRILLTRRVLDFLPSFPLLHCLPCPARRCSLLGSVLMNTCLCHKINTKAWPPRVSTLIITTLLALPPSLPPSFLPSLPVICPSRRGQRLPCACIHTPPSLPARQDQGPWA